MAQDTAAVTAPAMSSSSSFMTNSGEDSLRKKSTRYEVPSAASDECLLALAYADEFQTVTGFQWRRMGISSTSVHLQNTTGFSLVLKMIYKTFQ